MVTNVEVWQDDRASMDVQSCVRIEEFRKGVRQSFVGRQLHRLVADGTEWRILYRILMLLIATPIKGTSHLFSDRSRRMKIERDYRVEARPDDAWSFIRRASAFRRSPARCEAR